MTTAFKSAFALMSAVAACVVLSGADARAEEPAAGAADMQKIYAALDASNGRAIEIVVRKTEDAIALKLSKIDNPFNAPAPAPAPAPVLTANAFRGS